MPLAFLKKQIAPNGYRLNRQIVEWVYMVFITSALWDRVLNVVTI
jgi:hypothetical protein